MLMCIYVSFEHCIDQYYIYIYIYIYFEKNAIKWWMRLLAHKVVDVFFTKVVYIFAFDIMNLA